MDRDHESASRMTAPPTPGKADAGWGPWKISRVVARPAENGGVIVNCEKRRERTAPYGKNQPEPAGSSYEDKDYAFTNVDEALSFMATELGGEPAGGTGMGDIAAPPSTGGY